MWESEREKSREQENERERWSSILQKPGWATHLTKLTSCTAAEVDQHSKSLMVDNMEIKMESRKIEIQVLGTITSNNRFDMELNQRIEAAWTAFSQTLHNHVYKLHSSKETPWSSELFGLAILALAAVT